MRWWAWLKECLLYRRMTRAERKYHRWRQDVERLSKVMDRHNKQLRTVRSQLVSISESVSEDLEESRLVMDRQAEVVGELNAELEILKETTVPFLTAAHQVAMATMDADASVQIRRRVSMMPQEREE